MKEQIWCPLAFHSIMTKTDGVFKTCCVGKKYAVDDKGNNMNRSNSSIEEAFFSNSFVEIRKNLENGIRDSNCDVCWAFEDLGIESYRQSEIKKLNFEIDFVPSLKHADLALGNQCNLKCRTCNPNDSSLWAKEFYDLDLKNKTISFRDFQKNQIYLENISDQFLENFVKTTMPFLTHISFFGGEPFLMNVVWQIIEKAIELDYSKKLNLIFNTNGTIWDEEKIKLLEKFQSVEIRFSIDSIGQRFEYLRHPAKWQQVESNINRCIAFSKLHKQISIRIDCSVSALNIWYVYEVLEFSRSYNIEFYINPVAYPRSLGLLDIPECIKLEIKSRLSSLDINECEKIQFDKLIEILFWETTSGDWGFEKEIKIRDLYRKEDFSKTFPDYFSFLQQYLQSTIRS
jgi:sulfatase maturation enzyme AslB (radical SAM superfamily)